MTSDATTTVPCDGYNSDAPGSIPARVPEFDGTEDKLTAALMYAACGWYVLPVLQDGGAKHPGSVVGAEWQHKSSRDPEQIRAWFTGTDYNIALHTGKSGAVVIDLDHPEHWPAEYKPLLLSNSAPFQSGGYDDDPEHGHYVFADPERQFGSGLSKFPFKGWGEVRGGNAVIIAYPSVKTSGLRYTWESDGDAAMLPALLESWLSAPGATVKAHDGEVPDFLAAFPHAGDDMSPAYEVLTWQPGENNNHVIAKCGQLLDLAASGEPGVIAAWREYLANGTDDANAVHTMQRKIPEWTAKRAEDAKWDAYISGLPAAPKGSTPAPSVKDFIPSGGSDAVIAKRIASRSQGKVVYGRDTGAYYAPGSLVWAEYPVDLVIREAADAMPSVEAFRKALGTDTTGDAAAIEADDDKVKAYKRAKARMASADGRGAVKRVLGAEMHAAGIKVAELDSEPYILWAGGTAYDLRTGQAAADGAYVPAHLKTCPVAPVAGPTPVFDLVTSAMWPDLEVRAYALRVIAGELLWGATSKVHPVLDSPPNGLKSTFAEILLTVLGSYAVQVTPDVLIGGRNDTAADQARSEMIGARMVHLDEPPGRDKASITQFKELASGTGAVTGRRMRQDIVTAPKRYNFLICQNPETRLPLDAQGVAERIAFIPCDASTPMTLAAYYAVQAGIEGEHAAILHKLVSECARYRAGERLAVPHAVQMAIDAARDDGDELTYWLLDNYDVLPPETPNSGRTVTIDTLRSEYNRAFPRRQLSRTAFRDRLEAVPVHVSTAPWNGRRNLAAVGAKRVAQW